MTERQIQVVVARADLFVTAALRVILAVGILTAALLLAALIIRRARGHPDRLDYDVTSEGPENDHTAAWFEWDEEHAPP